MRASLTMGRGEHDVVFECDHRFYAGCAATLENPAEYDEHEFSNFVVLEFGEWKRRYPCSADPRNEWWQLANEIVQSLYDELSSDGDEFMRDLIDQLEAD